MPAVFLSYRRSDSGEIAARLSETFKAQVGKRWSFLDVPDLTPGADWQQEINSNLAGARVVCVLIGPTWVEEMARRESLKERDVLRAEIAAALSRKGRRVVPVLVHGARMPSASDLPENIRALMKRQVFELRDASWDADVARLVQSIGRPYRWRWLVARSLAAFFVGAALVRVALPWVAPLRGSDYAFVRLLVFGLLGAYVVLELVIAGLYLARQRR